MGKIIVIRKADRILVFTFSDYRPDALQVFFSPGKDDLVGNVYVGRVDRVLPSMGAAFVAVQKDRKVYLPCLLYTSPSPRDMRRSRMPSSA